MAAREPDAVPWQCRRVAAGSAGRASPSTAHASGCRWTDLGIGLTWPLVAPIRQSLHHLDDIINSRPALDLLRRSRLRPSVWWSSKVFTAGFIASRRNRPVGLRLSKRWISGSASDRRPLAARHASPAPLHKPPPLSFCSGHSSWPSPGTVGRRIWLRRRSDPEALPR